MKINKYRADRLVCRAYKEAENNKNFKKAEKYYNRLLKTKETVEKLLDVSIITGTEENLSEEDNRRFEFINIMEGIIEPEESTLRNKDFYKTTDEKHLTFPASYLWDDSTVPWKNFLYMEPKDIISAGAERARVQTDFRERMKELIYGIKRGDVVLTGPDNIRLNSYVMERGLELVEKYNWRKPVEFFEFDRAYMRLKQKNGIIKYSALNDYCSEMLSRRDKLVEMLIEQAI